MKHLICAGSSPEPSKPSLTLLAILWLVVHPYNLRGASVEVRDLADNSRPTSVPGVGVMGASALLYFARLPYIHTWKDLDFYSDFRSKVDVIRRVKQKGW